MSRPQNAWVRLIGCCLGLTLACGLPVAVRGEVRIEGSSATVRVTTGHEPIADVLAALRAPFHVQYRSAIPLDAAAERTYSGSVQQVIARLLDGYNYVIRRDGEASEILISGRRGQVAPPPRAKATEAQGVLSRWR